MSLRLIQCNPEVQPASESQRKARRRGMLFGSWVYQELKKGEQPLLLEDKTSKDDK